MQSVAIGIMGHANCTDIKGQELQNTIRGHSNMSTLFNRIAKVSNETEHLKHRNDMTRKSSKTGSKNQRLFEKL